MSGHSGHGNFKAKLRGFNLVDSDRCVHYGVPETAQAPVFIECQLFQEERVELRDFSNEIRLTMEKQNFVKRKKKLQASSPGCAER